MSGATRDRLVTAAAVVVLLGAGFLIGSFWLEWRDVPLASPDDSASALPANLPAGWEDRVRVEVLNGYGEPGAAAEAADRLRAMGFDVVYFGNADSFEHDSTRVLVRSEDRGGVRRVADSLGVDSVRERPEPSLHLDATIVLGPEWERLLRQRRASAAQRRAPKPSFFEALRRRLGL